MFDRNYLAVRAEPHGMTEVTLTRDLPVDPETVRNCIREDLSAFVEASGFDSVTATGDTFVVTRHIGMATLELTLEVRESDALLYLEQTEGIFDEMWTEYTVEETDDGSKITATTGFTLGGVLGPILDGTMIATQRRKEFALQFDYLEAAVAPPA